MPEFISKLNILKRTPSRTRYFFSFRVQVCSDHSVKVNFKISLKHPKRD